MIELNFKNKPCYLVVGRYRSTGNLVLQLNEIDDEYPLVVAIASADIAEVLEKNEVAIKDYSENAGIMAVLIDAGVIEPPHYRMHSGGSYVDFPICKVNMDYIEKNASEDIHFLRRIQ